MTVDQGYVLGSGDTDLARLDLQASSRCRIGRRIRQRRVLLVSGFARLPDRL